VGPPDRLGTVVPVAFACGFSCAPPT
jgi:hypothetical protein